MSLKIENLHVSVDKKEVLHGVNVEIHPGEVHVIMGPNGSGKSTLANVLAGHPKYTVTDGSIILEGQDITHEKVHIRSRQGLFLSMQYLPEVLGVTVSNFLRTAVSAQTGEKQHPVKFHNRLLEVMKSLQIDPNFATRYLNVGFSGGEKKRLEILQLMLLQPKYAILDETDSGLDVDALKVVAEGINSFHTLEKGIVLITHHHKILRYIQPDFVHVMIAGIIVKTGTAELAKQVEEEGYRGMGVKN